MAVNVLKELANKKNDKIMVKTILGEEIYCFSWNEAANPESIKNFEDKNKCVLPNDYKEFLLTSNGAIIYKSEYEDDGYKLLSIEEIEKVTQEMKNDG